MAVSWVVSNHYSGSIFYQTVHESFSANEHIGILNMAIVLSQETLEAWNTCAVISVD